MEKYINITESETAEITQHYNLTDLIMGGIFAALYQTDGKQVVEIETAPGYYTVITGTNYELDDYWELVDDYFGRYPLPQPVRNARPKRWGRL